MVILFEDDLSNPPVAADAARYAEDIGDPPYPVTASPDQAILTATPYDGTKLPGKCILSPEMKILDCWTGHGDFDKAFALIEAHAAAQ